MRSRSCEHIDAGDSLRTEAAGDICGNLAVSSADVEQGIGRPCKSYERVCDTVCARHLDDPAMNFVKRSLQDLHDDCL